MLQPLRPQPQSRRDRPAKPPLSREVITETALELFQAGGLEKVTMRGLATALNTGPASLYVYFRDTNELHAGMLDRLLAKVLEKKPRGSWREKTRALLERYQALLFEHPALARMALSTPASGPNYLALVDTLLGCLHEGRVGDGEAAWAVDLLLLHSTAHAAEHATWRETPRAAEELAELRNTLGMVDARRHPNVARVGAELLSGSGLERQRYQLDVLLNGITDTRRTAGKKKPR